MRTKFKNNVIAALDIGSSKIVCLIAELQENDSLKVHGIGHHLSQGFKGTAITDIKLAESSIISAVYEAEKMAGFSIEKIFLSIDGVAITDESLEMEMVIDEQVSEKDLKDLLYKTINSFNNKNKEVLHFFPLDYGLDGTFGIKNPVSMYGHSLEIKAKVIYLPSSHVVNLINCLEKCRLSIVHLTISGFAAAFSCLSNEEKDQGVTLIDIGADTTSLIIFYQNNIIACGHLPIGGNHITLDISYGLTLDSMTAEKIKIMKGNAFLTSFDSGNMIEIESKNIDDKKQYISAADLSMIIRARLEEIFEMAKNKMEQMNVKGLASKRIVLTGGTSNLVGIKEIASNIFANSVKIAIPHFVEGMGVFNSRVDFSAAVGMLYYAKEQSKKILKGNKKFLKLSNNSHFSKIFKWFKENL